MSRVRVALCVTLASLLAFAACDGERTAIVAGPPLTIEPLDAAVQASAVDAGPPAPASPITATFVDLTPRGMTAEARPCEYVALTVTRGKGETSDGPLGVGDVLVVHGRRSLTVKGEGIALLAAIRDDACEGGPGAAKAATLVHAADAKELTWGGGAMHAHLDVLDPLGGVAYLGRLEGTSKVGEHAHDASWEVLAAAEGSGTLTVAGKAVRVGPRSVVVIPPGTKHAWTPDEGSHLVAVQLYGPPGPEQRFKLLAAAEAADGGAAPRGDGGAKSDGGGLVHAASGADGGTRAHHP